MKKENENIVIPTDFDEINRYLFYRLYDKDRKKRLYNPDTKMYDYTQSEGRILTELENEYGALDCEPIEIVGIETLKQSKQEVDMLTSNILIFDKNVGEISIFKSHGTAKINEIKSYGDSDTSYYLQTNDFKQILREIISKATDLVSVDDEVIKNQLSREFK